MGIKGIYSLLEEDPNRFGRSWVCYDSSSSSLTKESNTIIYIDGPALHHHLLSSSSSRLLEGTTCLWTLYYATQNFAALLHKTTRAREIHLIMDGVSSIYKKECQIQRMEERAYLCNDIATSLTKETKHKRRKEAVPNLFGEEVMIQALTDLDGAFYGPEKEDHLFYVHCAHGEAEEYIACLISSKQKKQQNQEEHVILSNDTDFFIYPSCANLVPLRALHFQRQEDSTNCVVGWMYSRAKFLSSYPSILLSSSDSSSISKTISSSTMIVVAALAGNDYTLPSLYQNALQKARNRILQSNIAGLRNKHRSSLEDIPAKKVALAILRFVEHYAKRYNNTAKRRSDDRDDGQGETSLWWWDYELCFVLTSTAKDEDGAARVKKSDKSSKSQIKHDILHDERKQNLSRAFELIYNIYHESEQQQHQQQLKHHPSADILRLVQQNIFYCRPIVETWTDQCCKKNKKSVHDHNDTEMGKDDGENKSSHSDLLNNRKGISSKKKKNKKKNGHRKKQSQKKQDIIDNNNINSTDSKEEGDGTILPATIATALSSISLANNEMQSDAETQPHLPHVSLITSKISLSEDSGCSLWKVVIFTEIRKRLHTFIATYNKVIRQQQQQDECGAIVPTSSSTPSLITEYIRVNGGGSGNNNTSIRYNEHVVQIYPCMVWWCSLSSVSTPSAHPNGSDESDKKAIYQYLSWNQLSPCIVLEYCLFGKRLQQQQQIQHSKWGTRDTKSFYETLQRIPPKFCMLFLSSLLLGRKDAFVFILIGTTVAIEPSMFCTMIDILEREERTKASAASSPPLSPPATTANSAEILRAMNRFEVACHHIMLVIDAILFVFSSPAATGTTDPYDSLELNTIVQARKEWYAHITFRHDIAFMVWEVLGDLGLVGVLNDARCCFSSSSLHSSDDKNGGASEENLLDGLEPIEWIDHIWDSLIAHCRRDHRSFGKDTFDNHHERWSREWYHNASAVWSLWLSYQQP